MGGKIQKERLREYLDTGKSISHPEAQTLLNIPNLSTAIKQLNSEGYITAKETIHGKNYTGDWVYTVRHFKSDHKF